MTNMSHNVKSRKQEENTHNVKNSLIEDSRFHCFI